MYKYPDGSVDPKYFPKLKIIVETEEETKSPLQEMLSDDDEDDDDDDEEDLF